MQTEGIDPKNIKLSKGARKILYKLDNNKELFNLLTRASKELKRIFIDGKVLSSWYNSRMINKRVYVINFKRNQYCIIKTGSSFKMFEAKEFTQYKLQKWK